MPEDTQLNDRCKHFELKQQKTNKSLDSQIDLLMNLKRNTYKVCAIQELYINQNGKTRANAQWITIYPSTHNLALKATRLVILINTNILTNNWKQLHIEHLNITAVELTTSIGNIWLFNIYNDCKNNDSLDTITTYMKTNLTPRSIANPTHQVWLRDFN